MRKTKILCTHMLDAASEADKQHSYHETLTPYIYFILTVSWANSD